jgi:hypothetical protein
MVSIFAIIGVLSTLYTDCTKESLAPLSQALVGVYNYAAVNANFCLSTPSAAAVNVKYLFILDHSGSNKPGSLVSGDAQNTDPTGSRRYGPLATFVESLAPNPNGLTGFDIIDFSDSAAPVGGLNDFDYNGAQDFIDNYVLPDWEGPNQDPNNPSPVDAGFTNYEAALTAAYQLILYDLQLAAYTPSASIVTNNYQIIFVTDGVPTVNNNGALYTQTISDLQATLDQINGLKNQPGVGPYVGSITLNTAFYYNSSTSPTLISNAESLLSAIATQSNGLFLEFGIGQNVLYQQFSPPQTNLQNQLADVFVKNENAVWWDNGQLMLDSDGDGLPDLIEQQFGSNPYNPDSDGNGVNDLVEYRSKGKPCNASNCSKSGADPYAICAGFNPTTDSQGNVTYSSSSNDGLNDCEKLVAGGNYQLFSSPQNFIPDKMAFANSMSIQPSNANVALSQPFADGYTNYYKLKLGLPTTVSAKNLVGFVQRTNQLTVTSTPNASTTCYSLAVNNVALTAPNNKITVYLVQNPSLMQDKPFLMKATGIMGGNSTVTFQPSDFHN